jgi:hypothetical protein
LEYIIYELQISCLQDKKGDMMTVMEAIINLQLMRSMIKAYGEMGIENLRDIFINTQKTHEDVISIAALCFYTEEEFFLKPGLENNIDLAFNKAKGTACKIALALALDNFGKKDKLDKLRSKIDKFEWPLESFNRGNSLPFAHVLLDIASNGEVHRGKFFWKR